MGGRQGTAISRGNPAPIDDTPPRGVIREWLETFIVCGLLIVFARGFVFMQSEIPSGSMEQTLLIGDTVLVDRFRYAPTTFDWEHAVLPLADVRRGDVVVFRYPPAPEQDFIKRVIGLPGETVELRDGRLWVDGRAIAEPYVLDEHRLADPRRNLAPVKVEPEHYLVFGDHRNASADSRVWGQVHRDLLRGRAICVLYSTASGAAADRQTGEVTPWSLVTKLYHLVVDARLDRFFRAIH